LVRSSNYRDILLLFLSGATAAASSFGPFGPCNVSRLLRDMSGGPWTPLSLYNQ
jgi:hypothetical protein